MNVGTTIFSSFDIQDLDSVNKESVWFEGLWYLFNLCVGTAVGNEISIQWWPENNTKIDKN